MYAVEVIPLTKIPIQLPQVFSYFSARALPAGALVLVGLGRRQEEAIIIETHDIKSHKIEIKSADYEMRPIKKVLNPEPVLTPQQIKLALWLGQYYFAPPGLFLKMMIRKITNNIPISQYPNIQKLIIAPTVTHVNITSKKYSNAVIIHSGLRAKQLNENWQKIASGEAEIIVGTRLAVFAPFLNLKEIIIEDETNSGHRSWDMFPRYRAHEIARKLAEIFGAKLTFRSDLPSVEFLLPFVKGGWEGFTDNTYKINPPSPPFKKGGNTEIIDLRQELHEGNFSIFSRLLQKSINEALVKKQQIILFINRRGLATFVLCRDCGYVVKCQNCEAPLAYHTIKTSDGLKPILLCHHCGQKQNLPAICPQCQSRKIKAFGTGTEKVEAEAERLFKNVCLLRLDSDNAKKLSDQQNIIEKFRQKKADILIGTQMILNHELPKVALVAIISADTLMHLPDFRSNERLFQTIWQLKSKFCHSRKSGNPDSGSLPSGQAGRVKPGMTDFTFLIQTYNPEHKILQLAAEGNFEKFYEQEIENRKILKYPPFSQLIKLTYRHRDPKRAGAEAKILHAKLTQQLKTSTPLHLLDSKVNKIPKPDEINHSLSIQLHNLRCGGTILSNAILEISDPVPAFISKQKGKYVWQIILKARPYWLAPPKLTTASEGGTAEEKDRPELLKTRNKFLSFVPSNWEIDIDPETLL